jgi:alkanesulfonate monooxygenase SsuD/methylene tetrahydromethanopterin reductase-like flavin-dependent oxidoreductase (luciferase family)
VGAGWNEADHRQHGLSFPDIKERADLLEDQLALLHGLWEEKPGWKFDGHQVTVRGGKLIPGPVQVEGRPVGKNGRRRPRIITGSEGSPRGFRLAARYSDEFNLSSSSPETARRKEAELDAACVAAGRDPKSLTRSTKAGVLLGRDREEVARRADALMAEFGESTKGGVEWLEARKSRWIMVTPDEARAMVARYAEAGIERIMLQDFLPHDLEHVDLMAEELLGKV